MNRTLVIEEDAWGREEYYIDWTGHAVERYRSMNFTESLPKKMPEFPITGLWWQVLSDSQMDDLTERTINRGRAVAGLPLNKIERLAQPKKPSKKQLEAPLKEKARQSYKRVVAMLDLSDDEKLAWLGGMK